MKVVKHEHQRCRPVDHLDDRLEDVYLAEVGRSIPRRQLGEDSAERRELPGVEIQATEHAPERCGERDVGQVLLQRRASRPAHSHSVERRGKLVEQPRFADARLTLDQHEGEFAGQR